MSKKTKQLLSLLLVLIMMLSLLPTTVLAAGKPTITTQPSNKTAAPNTTAVFSLKASGATSYQWQYRKTATGSWANSPATGNTTATLKVAVNANKNGYQYRCKVTNSSGSVYSNIVKLTVKPIPVITTQPTNKTAAPNTTAVFALKASNATSYQWQYRKTSTGSWANSGANGNNTNALRVAVNANKNGYQYRCKITNSYGSTYSNVVKLTVSSRVYRALCIGNYGYSDPLPGCDNDMYAMAGMLRGLKNKFTVTTRLSATAAQIRSAISSTFAGAGSNDVSLFYYSGHGMYSSYNSSMMGALVGVNYGVNSNYSDYITTSELASLLSAVPGRVIVILDSCHSGALIHTKGGQVTDADLDAFNQSVIDAFAAYDRDIDFDEADPAFGEGTDRAGEFNGKKKFVVITAADYSESSLSVTINGTPCGYFTYYFVTGTGSAYPSGTATGSIPCSSDKNITVTEIYNYTYNKISSRHHAQMYANNPNEVIFYRK